MAARELIRATMRAPAGGVGEVVLAAIAADGSERLLTTFTAAGLAPTMTPGSHPGWADRLLLSRSPDGTRVAVALGRALRTFSTTTGELLHTAAIDHSRPQLVFGWTLAGEPVARDTEDADGPDLPLAGGWTLRVGSVIDHDHGFGAGHHTSRLGMSWPAGQSAEELAEAIAKVRAEHAGGPRRIPPFRVSLFHGSDEIVVADEQVRPSEGYPSITWPPTVLPGGVLLRRTISRSWLEPPQSPVDPGVHGEERVLPAWFVRADGTVDTIPVELGQSPLCALPTGDALLPGSSPLWRNAAEEPLTVMQLDGTLDPLWFGGGPVVPSRILVACAPEWLPAARDEDGDLLVWPDDHDFWAQDAAVSVDGSELRLLLAERPWHPDARDPEECRWLVATVPLGESATGSITAITRGERAFGDQVAIAL